LINVLQSDPGFFVKTVARVFVVYVLRRSFLFFSFLFFFLSFFFKPKPPVTAFHGHLIRPSNPKGAAS
jgi:hypothetical protein